MDNFGYILNDYDLYENNKAPRDIVFTMHSRSTIQYSFGLLLKSYIRRITYEYNHINNFNFLIIFDVFMKENNLIQFVLEMEYEKK